MTTAEGTGDETRTRLYGYVSFNGHEQCFAEANRLRDDLEKARVLLRRMHGQYHAILGLAPPPKECVSACQPAATFLEGSK